MQNDTCQMLKPPNFDVKKHKKKAKRYYETHKLEEKRKKKSIPDSKSICYDWVIMCVDQWVNVYNYSRL